MQVWCLVSISVNIQNRDIIEGLVYLGDVLYRLVLVLLTLVHNDEQFVFGSASLSRLLLRGAGLL